MNQREFGWPENTAAIEIDSMLVSINFDTERVEEKRATSVRILRNQKAVPPFQLATEVGGTGDRILLHVVALRFFYRYGESYQQSNNRDFNPVEIYKVEREK